MKTVPWDVSDLKWYPRSFAVELFFLNFCWALFQVHSFTFLKPPVPCWYFQFVMLFFLVIIMWESASDNSSIVTRQACFCWFLCMLSGFSVCLLIIALENFCNVAFIESLCLYFWVPESSTSSEHVSQEEGFWPALSVGALSSICKVASRWPQFLGSVSFSFSLPVLLVPHIASL